LLCCCFFPTDVFGDKRRALVIANSDYRYATKLVTPSKDALLIIDRLRTLGFEVEPHENVTNASDLSHILHKFAERLDNETVALFYYAGHGMQHNGENFLIGVGARLAGDASLPSETYALNMIASTLEKQAETTILFWDACRNNPFASKLLVGAAPVAARSGNTFIVLSAAPGQEAIDGVVNSPFAAALAKHIATPNVPAEVMLTMVAGDVMAGTGRRQWPDRSSQLSRLFYFNAQSREAKTTDEQTNQYRAKNREAERPPAQQKQYRVVPVGSFPKVSGAGGSETMVTRKFISDSPTTPSFVINMPMTTIIRRIRMSPDGKILALGGDDGVIRLVNLETFAVMQGMQAHVGRVSDLDFTPDGSILLSSGRDGIARTWRVTTGELVKDLLKIPNRSLNSGRINPLRPDRYSLFGDYNGQLYAKDLKRDKLITDAKFHEGAVTVAYQPNGKGTFFSAGADGLLKIRLPEGQRVVRKAHDGRIFEADYDLTGTMAYTAGYDRKIKIWDTKNGFSSETPLQVMEGHLKYVLAASMSRKDKVLVSGGGDKAVSVWSVDSGKLRARLVGHTKDVEAVTITPDNRFVISTSEDKSVRIWSLENRQELLSIYFRAGTKNYAGMTFDKQIFGDPDSGLITVRVDGKELSSLSDEKHGRYIGREISIYEQ
jgi:WD40 repeat protein